jgi:hypothetical protein
MTDQVEMLEAKLNDFDLEVRTRALTQLLDMVDRGEIDLPPADEVANMHVHTFFSYNGYGYSPTGLAWLAKKRGIKLMGIVDFDVLDGVDEFLNACETARQRGSAGMETRAYVPEFAKREINSPGEPGVYYHMGIGFTESQVPATEPEAWAILAEMRDRAEARNRSMIERVNAYLDPVVLDYDRDVLPRTPSGNATERHMCAAYVDKAAETVNDPVAFWAEMLETSPDEIEAIIDDGPKIQGRVRATLMKRGGVGYVQPGPDTFPTVERVNRAITACGALPCITWLDGTSEGEQAADELFALMIRKGAVALNIIPDRNWNIDDPTEKALKLRNLYDVVEKARRLDLPINVGTEMNAYGKPRIDDFDAPELAPVRNDFLDGAYFIYGHTMLQRASALGFGSEWAKMHFPTRRERNAFYVEVGKRLLPGAEALLKIRAMGDTPAPQDILSL